ncbi:hypothetical protein D7Z54_30130 [Salibacterium salarium]|uniref:Uncharacterized protein n=1 Tax=Salibacterium salarium TaxID=284579 RepID=A0A3R9QFT1_9BACI|nr:hypothetical protein D7Z54_30130 [Salibacterium salarium]
MSGENCNISNVFHLIYFLMRMTAPKVAGNRKNIITNVRIILSVTRIYKETSTIDIVVWVKK